jgi:hypothetical protein
VFEVTVGDNAGSIARGYQLGLYLWRKGGSPDVREALGAVVDTAHPGLCCVGCAHEARVLRH